MTTKTAKVNITLAVRYDDALESGFGGEQPFIEHAFQLLDLDGMDVNVHNDRWISVFVEDHKIVSVETT